MPPPTLASNATSTPRRGGGVEDLLAVQGEQRLVRGDDVLAARSIARRISRRAALVAADQLDHDLDLGVVDQPVRRRRRSGRRERSTPRSRATCRGPRCAPGAAGSRGAAAITSAFSRSTFATPVPIVPRPIRPTPTARSAASPRRYGARARAGSAGCRARPGGCGARSRSARSAPSPRRSRRSRCPATPRPSPRASSCFENSSEPSARNGSGICAQTNIVAERLLDLPRARAGLREAVDQRVAARPVLVDGLVDAVLRAAQRHDRADLDRPGACRSRGSS